MKEQKGFIQILLFIVIIAGVLVFGIGGYLGVRQYQSYQNEKAEREKEVEEQQKALVQAQKEIEKLKIQNTETQKKQGALEQKIKAEQKPQVITNTIVKEIPATNTTIALDLPAIIKEWTPKIARITCHFKLDPKFYNFFIKNGLDYSDQTLSGSGLLTQTETNNVISIDVITNKHVINGHNGFSTTDSCEIDFPNGHKYFTDINDVYYQGKTAPRIEYISGVPYATSADSDSGWLRIKNYDSYIKELLGNGSATICKEFPQIGDGIVVLGYPGIGSGKGITATEGIISGIEQNFFVTSAKIEHGNSGGAAIFINKNCYFGIPTFAVSGKVESLARILDIRKVLDGY